MKRVDAGGWAVVWALAVAMSGVGCGETGTPGGRQPAEVAFHFQVPQPGKADAAGNGFLPEESLQQVEDNLDQAIAQTEGIIHGLESDIARLEQENQDKAHEIDVELQRIEDRKRQIEDNQTLETAGGIGAILIGIITLQPAIIAVGSVAIGAAIADDAQIQQSQRLIDQARQEQATIQQELSDYRAKRDALQARLTSLRAAKDDLLALLRATDVALPEGPSPELSAVAWRVDLLRQILSNNEEQIAILTEIERLAQAVGGALDEALATVRGLSDAADELLKESEDRFDTVVALLTSGDPAAFAVSWLIDQVAARTRQLLEQYSWPLAEFVDFLITNRASDWEGALDDLRERILDRLMNALTEEDGSGSGASPADGTAPDTGSEPPASPLVPASVVCGASHTCALARNGELSCWGDGSDGEADAPAEPLARIGSADDRHTCAIRQDGTATCWGLDDRGQCDAPAGTFVDITAGTGFSCGIRSDATIACWGDDSDGQAEPPEGRFVALSAGSYHVCAIRTDGTLACWGADDFGATDAPAGTFIAVDGGLAHTCGIREDGTIACWGLDDEGEADAPAGVFLGVSAAATYSCGNRADDRTLVCWGGVDDGGAGLGQVPAGRFVAVSAGSSHACGVAEDGSVACWGADTSGDTAVPAGLDLF